MRIVTELIARKDATAIVIMNQEAKNLADFCIEKNQAMTLIMSRSDCYTPNGTLSILL